MSEETPPPPPPSKRSAAAAATQKFLWIAAILFVIWLIFGQIVPHLLQKTNNASNHTNDPSATSSHPKQATINAQRIEAMSTRIQQREAKLSTFEEVITAAPQSVETPTDDTAPPDASISDTMEMAPEETETPLSPVIAARPTPATAISHDRLAQLEAKLATLETQLEANKAESKQRLAMITTFAQLKEAFARGDHFVEPLSHLRVLTKDSKAALEPLSQLAVFADKGVPTLTDLQKAFEAALPKALGKNTDSLTGSLQSLVSIRKVGANQQGVDDESVLARAEARLADGELKGTTKELEKLSPTAATAFNTWMQDANRHLRAREAMNALQLALGHD